MSIHMAQLTLIRNCHAVFPDSDVVKRLYRGMTKNEALDKNNCPKFLGVYLKNCEDEDKEGEESCIRPPHF
jgi:hypothetical protein